jgi:DNA-binding transcriptional MerR regulator
MARYTVKQLGRLSGVSVRTLHHYDEIGLLKPAFTGENRYRYYGREELLRLQAIMFHRELGVPLKDIARLLDSERDRVEILHEHRAALAERMKRSRQLLRTIDRTIAELNGEETMKDKQLYQGFDPAKQAEYEEWLVDRYGGDMRERIDQSKAKMETLGADGRAARIAEGGEVSAPLATAFKSGVAAEDPANDALVAMHHAWIAKMWDRACPPEAYAGLADLYLAHPDFRTTFDEMGGEGFLDWMTAAMKAYAARVST